MKDDGFFTNSQTEIASRPGGKRVTCAACGLYQYVLSPKMEAFGNFSKGILNIGEAPGKTEDKKAKPWQGKAGRALQRTYEKLGIDLFEDCLNINAVQCHPTTESGANRTPTPNEIACCRQRVFQVIKEYKPKVIVLLGNIALTAFLGHRWKNNLGGVTKWRGWTIPDRDYNAWVCPTYHPSYIQREDKFEIKTVWKQDLERAFSMTDVPLPEWEDETGQVEIIDSLGALKVNSSGLVAFDFEATGLKPYAKGHRIVCASVAFNSTHAQVFMIPPKRVDHYPFRLLLESKNVGKMAHNMKFEDTWSRIKLRQPVNNWVWDSMLAAHILDNRTGVTGLKFQTYVNFGVVDYSSEIQPYLETRGGNANDINRIFELISTPKGKEQLLTYCGLDSLFEYKLAMKQRGLMNV